MSIDDMIAVLQAAKAGKQIQCGDSSEWVDIDKPIWNFGYCDFRVKPETREWWINTYGNGSVHVHQTKFDADDASDIQRRECIKVREVLE